MRKEILRVKDSDGAEHFCIRFKRHWYTPRWKYVSVDGCETDVQEDAKLSTTIEQASKVLGDFFQNRRKCK